MDEQIKATDEARFTWVKRWRFWWVSMAIILTSVLILLGALALAPDEQTCAIRRLNPAKDSLFSLQRYRQWSDHLHCSLAELPVRARAAAPQALVRSVRQFLTGAALVLSVGNTLSQAASGYVPDCVYGQEDAVRMYTTSKFWIALGSSCCEIFIIRLLFPRGHQNSKQNRVSRWFSTTQGWVVLLLLMTIPNGVISLGVPVVCLSKLPQQLYVPIIFISNLIKPYIVAAIRNSRWFGSNSSLCSPDDEGFVQLQDQKRALLQVSKTTGVILSILVLLLMRFIVALYDTDGGHDHKESPSREYHGGGKTKAAGGPKSRMKSKAT